MDITLKSKDVVTKKEHICYSCHRKFPKNTKMNYYVGIYEDDFNTLYSCMTCISIMNICKESEYPEGFVYEMLNKEQTPEDKLKELHNDKYK